MATDVTFLLRSLEPCLQCCSWPLVAATKRQQCSRHLANTMQTVPAIHNKTSQQLAIGMNDFPTFTARVCHHRIKNLAILHVFYWCVCSIVRLANVRLVLIVYYCSVLFWFEFTSYMMAACHAMWSIFRAIGGRSDLLQALQAISEHVWWDCFVTRNTAPHSTINSIVQLYESLEWNRFGLMKKSFIAVKHFASQSYSRAYSHINPINKLCICFLTALI